MRRKVLLIGWDAADWRIIRPLMAEGKMPNLQALMSYGSSGNLSTLNPPLSPMLWTSIATGKRPFKHGIHGFSEPDPDTGFIRPISSRSRTTKAFWNILSQQGLRVNVIGWWPSHPAEDINGVMVSNLFHQANRAPDQEWGWLPGSVHPASMTERLAELRVHPGELTARELLPFIPSARGRESREIRRLPALAKITAECASIQAMATEVMASEDWDCTAVYFDGIDHYGHGFMKFHPPRRDSVSEADFELYRHVMTAAYQFHDSMLGVLVAQAGANTSVMLLSDHGFHPDSLRPESIPVMPAGPAAEHRQYGILVLAGPWARCGETIHRASVLDICPTLLHAFGLPVGEDMDGRVLAEVLRGESLPTQLPSWDAVDDGRGGASAALPAPLSAEERQAALNQLVDLGYIEAPDENQREALDRTLHELRYNLGCSYLDAYRYEEANRIFAELYAGQPDDYRFGLKHIACLLAMGRSALALEVIDEVMARKQVNMGKARQKLAEVQKKIRDKEVDPDKLSRREQYELRKLRAEAGIRPSTAVLLRATALVARKRDAEALRELETVRAEGSTGIQILLQMGEIYTRLKKYPEAEEVLLRASKLDDEHAAAAVGLAQLYLAWRRSYHAAAEALRATELEHFNPKAHYLLGVAMHRLGWIDRAVEALRLALNQNPVFPEAHRRLAYILKNRLDQPEEALRHRELAVQARRRLRRVSRGRGRVSRAEIAGEAHLSEDRSPEDRPFAWLGPEAFPSPSNRDFVTVVSGLPRSGTSLMMQILNGSGFPALTDEIRGADENNPKGYFEYEAVKHLRRGLPDVLLESEGKSVKVIAQLLRFLPFREVDFRVVFMQRPLDEVVRSQRKMLQNLGRKGGELSATRLQSTFQGQLLMISEWLRQQQIPVLVVPYHDCLTRPEDVADALTGFLGETVTTAHIRAHVDPRLCRHGFKPVRPKGGTESGL